MYVLPEPVTSMYYQFSLNVRVQCYHVIELTVVYGVGVSIVAIKCLVAHIYINSTVVALSV